MLKMNVGDWPIEYDREATLRAYALLPTAEQNCGCINCKNYALSSRQFPAQTGE